MSVMFDMVHLDVFKNNLRALVYRSQQAQRVEMRVDSGDVLHWLEKQSCEIERFYWRDRGDEFVMAGLGVADHICLSSVNDAVDYWALMQERLHPEFPQQRYLGGIPFFDHMQSDELWGDLAQSYFVLPLIELGLSSRGMYLACNVWGEDEEQFEKTKLKALANMDRVCWPEQSDDSVYQLSCLDRQDFPKHHEWLQTIGLVLDEINRCDLQKVVMARRSSLICEQEIDAIRLLRQLSLTTQDCYQFCFQLNPQAAFIGVSPERLYQRKQRLIRSEALAGTRPRGATEAEDRLLSIELMSSHKDIQEHRFVIEQIMQDLEPLTESLRVNREVSLIKLHRGQHLFAGVKGLLKETVSDKQLVQVLHPTPALGGTPREKALQLIRDWEPFERGWYSGLVGWVARDEVEFAVAIRSALVKGAKMHLFSGAGIVKGSSPEAEWNEIENKIANFIDVVS